MKHKEYLRYKFKLLPNLLAPMVLSLVKKLQNMCGDLQTKISNLPVLLHPRALVSLCLGPCKRQESVAY